VHADRAPRGLQIGHSLLAYPEGKISPDGAIGEFMDGAFVIAIASQVPVVPVAIAGTRRIWPPGRAAIHGGQVRVFAGSPLPTSGLTEHDVARLREQARDVICSAHRDLVTAMSARETHHEQTEHAVRSYQSVGSPRRPRRT